MKLDNVGMDPPIEPERPVPTVQSEEPLVHSLGAHPFLRGLTVPQLQGLAACARVMSFPKGAYILREGGNDETLYLLTNGRVVLEIQIPGRGVLEVETLQEGDILGLYWLLPPHRWCLDARAAEPVDSIGLDCAAVRARADADPALGYAVCLRLLHQAYEQIEHVCLQYFDVYRREAPTFVPRAAFPPSASGVRSMVRLAPGAHPHARASHRRIRHHP